jgi:methionine biosynthesis protein MetW
MIGPEESGKVPFVKEPLGRSDYAIIGELIQPGTKVLDLGCGDGELLAWLQETKRVEARGVEIDRNRVQRAIARGVTVYQGDIAESLSDYPEGTFDYVILSQTLQEVRRPLHVLQEILRVAERVVIAFPNFGHWRVRWTHLISGRAPRTELFPYEWYASPNIHFLTLLDFEEVAAREHWTVERRIYLSGHRKVRLLPNLLAEVAVYMIRA